MLAVGNLTLGGTGKTPVVILLADWLLAEGKRVAILSRGYRRASTDRYLLVSNGERLLVGPREAGDESFLIAQRCPKAIAMSLVTGSWNDFQSIVCSSTTDFSTGGSIAT